MPETTASSHERYEDSGRTEVVEWVPAGVTSILDVGCFRGGFGATIKVLRPEVEVWGIEPDPAAAATAAGRLDRVVVGNFPADVPAHQFDCIVFNDVLEHMVDPWAALRACHSMLESGATVVASVPNVRHLTVVLPLLLRGQWNYKDSGILDRTHLRFFTRKSMVELFSDAGLHVEEVRPIRVATGGRAVAALKVIECFGQFGRNFSEGLRAERYVVVARIP